jgi:hypothetical protein
VLANTLADAVAVALALALPAAAVLGATEEAALMGTAVEPAVAAALVVAEALAVADALGEDVCAAAADANTMTVTTTSASILASASAGADGGTKAFLLNNIYSLLLTLGDDLLTPNASYGSRCDGVGASPKWVIFRPAAPRSTLSRVARVLTQGPLSRCWSGS